MFTTISSFIPRATAMLLAVATLAFICATLPKTAHAQERLGQIMRFHHAVDAGQRTLSWGSNNDEATILKAKPVELRMTYTLNTSDANGKPIQHHIVVDCLSKELKSCDWMQAAATSLGYTRNSGRGAKQGELAAYCAVYGEVARCSGPHGMPDSILNAYNRAQADAKAQATAASKK